MDRSGPEVIKLFSCSTQLSMKFQMLINVKVIKISRKFRFKKSNNLRAKTPTTCVVSKHVA